MPNQESAAVFDKERASTSDTRAARVAPLRDALHLSIRLVLSDLPSDARILCVGVGTGLELIYLAQEFPQWQFTAVEPATAMLETASTEALATGYQPFRQEALNLKPNYSPQTVNTDGWKETQTAWRQLFGQITVVLCFLHSVLGT